jgi:L-arabinose isomerase
MKKSYKQLRVGLLGLGLQAYWAQFEGLEERLKDYLHEVAESIEGTARIVVNLGLVDKHARALEAGHLCRSEDIDLLLVYATTYALSATVLPVLLRAGVPVILLNLQPDSAIDYARFNSMASRSAMTGEWLAYCGSCPVPEIANVMRRLGMPLCCMTIQHAGSRWKNGCRPLKQPRLSDTADSVCWDTTTAACSISLPT